MSISSSTTPAALRVEIKPSNYFRIALIGVALSALGAIFYAELTWLPRLSLAAATLWYGDFCWRRHTRQRGALQWRGVWFWRGADGSERALRLLHSTVWPGLIVLIFYDIERRGIERGHRFVLTLLPDSFARDGREQARRLRVYLNHFPVFTDGEVADG